MRLIDADALKEDIDNLRLFKKWIREEIKQHIDNSPTVDSSDTKYLEERDADAWESGYIQGLTERPHGDLISRSEAKKLGATCLAKRNENGQLEAIISLENAPTVDTNELKPLVDKVVEILPELTDAIIKELPKVVSGKIKCSECPYYTNTFNGEWVRKEDVIHNIAEQYSAHNELIPIWLSTGDLKGGAE